MPAPDPDALLDWGRSLRLTGDAEHVRRRPWATTARVGQVWLKACGAGTRHEAPLLGALLWWGAPHVVLPLAVDAVHGFVALPHSGELLRDLGRDAQPWPELLSQHAALQRRLEAHAHDAVGLGLPDLRPDRLPAALDALLSRTALPDDLRAAVVAVQRRLAGRSALLDAAPVRPSVQHDDLHDGNVVVDAAGAMRVVDWGDASVGHPFGVLLVALRSLAPTLGPADVARLTDGYLEAWTDVADRAALRELVDAAQAVQPLARALAWERALQDADAAEREPWGDPVARWLGVLVERLSG